MNDWNVAFEVRRDVVREEEEEGGVGEGEGEEWSRSLEKLMLEKKNENWEMLKNGRVDGEIGRVDVDNWLKMSRWKDVLKGVKMEKVKLWLEDVEEEGLVVCEAFVGRLVRNMMVVVRSSDMEQ